MILRSPRDAAGFTIIELIMVVLLISLLSVTAVVKWPSGFDSRAALLEFTQAVRYAQHMAMTREWTSASSSWGITVAANRYYVGRADVDCVTDCSATGCAETAMCGRALLDRSGLSLSAITRSQLFFNGLGEPIDSSGSLLGNSLFLVGGDEYLTVCSGTGYVLEGNSCP